jgi:hypothetical protein
MLAIALLIWFLDHPVTRYQQFLPQLAAARAAASKIDVVFIGQSGLLTFVSAEKIARELGARGHQPTSVLDLSRNWEGIGSHYVSIRDLLEKTRPKVIAVQYREADEREHAAFHQIGTVGDQIESSFAIETRGFFWRMQRTLYLLARKLVDASNSLLKGRYSEPTLVFENTHVIDPTPDPDIVSVARRKAWIEKVGPADLEAEYSWSLENPKDSRNRSYYARLSDLAATNGSKLVLIDLPLLNRSPLALDFVTLSEQRYNAFVFTFDREALSALYPDGFADHGHGSALGQDIFAQEMAQFLAERGFLR